MLNSCLMIYNLWLQDFYVHLKLCFGPQLPLRSVNGTWRLTFSTTFGCSRLSDRAVAATPVDVRDDTNL